MATMKEISLACDRWLTARGLERLTLKEVIARESRESIKAFRKYKKAEQLQTLEGEE